MGGVITQPSRIAPLLSITKRGTTRRQRSIQLLRMRTLVMPTRRLRKRTRSLPTRSRLQLSLILAWRQRKSPLFRAGFFSMMLRTRKTKMTRRKKTKTTPHHVDASFYSASGPKLLWSGVFRLVSGKTNDA